jgi:hypothetical protein
MKLFAASRIVATLVGACAMVVEAQDNNMHERRLRSHGVNQVRQGKRDLLEEETRFGVAVEFSGSVTSTALFLIDHAVQKEIARYVKNEYAGLGGQPVLEPLISTGQTMEDPEEAADEGEENEEEDGEADEERDPDGSDPGEGGGEHDELGENGEDQGSRFSSFSASRTIFQRSGGHRSLQRFQCTFSYCSVIGCALCPRRRSRQLQSGAGASCLPRNLAVEQAIEKRIQRACGDTGICGGATVHVYVVSMPPGSLTELTHSEICV